MVGPNAMSRGIGPSPESFLYLNFDIDLNIPLDMYKFASNVTFES